MIGIRKGVRGLTVGVSVIAIWLSLGVPAQAAETAAIDSGDTAWILVATALVLFMTIPALALFYGGLVRTKNVLSILMQCLLLTALMSIIWIPLSLSQPQ